MSALICSIRILKNRVLQKVCLSLSILFFILIQNSSVQAQGYQINCEIKGIEPGSTTFLLYISGTYELKKAETKAGPIGDLHFMGPEKLKPGVYKVVMQGQKTFNLIVDKQSKIDVKANIANPQASMEVLNDEENKYYYQYLNTIEINQGRIDTLKHILRRAKTTEDSIDIIKKGNAAVLAQNLLKTNFMKAHPFNILSKIIRLSIEPAMPESQLEKNPSPTQYLAYYKDHFLDNINFEDTVLMHLPEFKNKINLYLFKVTKQEYSLVWKEATYILEKIKKNKELYEDFVNYFTFVYEGSSLNDMDALFVNMANKYFLPNQNIWKDSMIYNRIKDRVDKASVLIVGSHLPTLNLKDKEDVWHSSDEGSTKFTVVVFWDPDCKHCVHDVPILKQYYDEVHDKGVDVYAVNIGSDPVLWRNFTAEHDFNWVNVADFENKFNLLSRYDVNSYPQFFVLDKDKKILAKKIDIEHVKLLLDQKLGIKR